MVRPLRSKHHIRDGREHPAPLLAFSGRFILPESPRVVRWAGSDGRTEIGDEVPCSVETQWAATVCTTISER